MSDRILFRRGNQADLPTLNPGEPGFALDTKKLYIGTASGNQGIVSTPPATATWIAPTLLNSWVNFGGGYSDAGYYKDDLGIVRLRGLIKNGTTTGGTVLFTLPVGYRPASTTAVPSFSSNAGSAVPFLVEIFSNGSVQIETGRTPGNTFLTLENITFRT